jgi:hypothetical protein
LSGSDPLVLEFPPFMLDVLEVVNSPVESPKLGKLDSLVEQTGQSGFVSSDGSQGHRWLWRGCSSPSQVASN